MFPLLILKQGSQSEKKLGGKCIKEMWKILRRYYVSLKQRKNLKQFRDIKSYYMDVANLFHRHHIHHHYQHDQHDQQHDHDHRPYHHCYHHHRHDYHHHHYHHHHHHHDDNVKRRQSGVGSGWRGNLGFSLEATPHPPLLDHEDGDDDDDGGGGDDDDDADIYKIMTKDDHWRYVSHHFQKSMHSGLKLAMAAAAKQLKCI